jgi:hypothetical protein
MGLPHQTLRNSLGKFHDARVEVPILQSGTSWEVQFQPGDFHKIEKGNSIISI